MSDSYPCPYCGHRVLGEMPGSYEICPVCFWEDDGVQFRWPTMAGGANKVSLIEAQRNYQDFGACDELGRRFVDSSAGLRAWERSSVCWATVFPSSGGLLGTLGERLAGAAGEIGGAGDAAALVDRECGAD
ncbi:CPCC family cysteine-rich protein [Streptomyces cinerochromogenes]|uniref:CPCC family cysteine-rich protein n=1 Tax=Streptomyces cinerochromogenes TaxID=66422 RepID=UPI00369E8673